LCRRRDKSLFASFSSEKEDSFFSIELGSLQKTPRADLALARKRMKEMNVTVERLLR
jgi:hypothetical protein